MPFFAAGLLGVGLGYAYLLQAQDAFSAGNSRSEVRELGRAAEPEGTESKASTTGLLTEGPDRSSHQSASALIRPNAGVSASRPDDVAVVAQADNRPTSASQTSQSPIQQASYVVPTSHLAAAVALQGQRPQIRSLRDPAISVAAPIVSPTAVTSVPVYVDSYGRLQALEIELSAATPGVSILASAVVQDAPPGPSIVLVRDSTGPSPVIPIPSSSVPALQQLRPGTTYQIDIADATTLANPRRQALVRFEPRPFRIETVVRGHLRWTGAAFANRAVLATDAEVELELSSIPDQLDLEVVDRSGKTVRVPGTPPGASAAATRLPIQFAAAGLHDVVVRAVERSALPGRRIITTSNRLQISVPPAPPVFAPAVVRAGNARHIELQTSPGFAPTAPITVHAGYLRLDGRAIATGAPLEFVLFEKTTADTYVWTAERVTPIDAIEYVGGTTEWRAELQLPPRTSGEAVLYVLGRQGANHQYSANPVYVQFGPAATGLAAPVITRIDKPATTQGNWVEIPRRETATYYANSETLRIAVRLQSSAPAGSHLVLLRQATPRVVGSLALSANAAAGTVPHVECRLPSSDRVSVSAALVHGAQVLESEPVILDVRTSGPTVLDVDARGFQFEANGAIVVRFNPENALDATQAVLSTHYRLDSIDALGVSAASLVEQALGQPEAEQQKLLARLRELRAALTNIAPAAVRYDAPSNRVTLEFAAVPPGRYRLTIADTLVDVYGNRLPVATHELVKPVGAEPPTITRGLPPSGGPYIPYPEFTPFRKVAEGFNPSDKVVTRVARLYYFRDAHRVAQIVNRKARSYNRQAVDMQQQVADQARDFAERATIERQRLEREAVRAAQAARQAEEALESFQQALVRARERLAQSTASVQRLDAETADREAIVATLRSRLDALPPGEPPRPQLQTDLAVAEAELDDARRERALAEGARQQDAEQVNISEQRVRVALGEVQARRQQEITATEQWDTAAAEEERAAKDQFRREVAAAHEDPDTFAPGLPGSIDPVEQVSVSVIGEGVIQLRGPRKGVNIVRTMINQIDAPVGQVRVGIHTVQINGENGDRMEIVADRIQRYIDHSRFLTVRSAQMLRNAVVLVASRRANQAALECPGQAQEIRDLKYLEAFFGADFLAELRTLDSEFLHTGNKLLSLHSMDTTSLSGALFLLSLAKNSVRAEILMEFERMLQADLAQAEQEFYLSAGRERSYGCHKSRFEFLAPNARFASLRGFFDAQLEGEDTMTPLQREFIRLAQIFKSRLVTEIEFNQRVMQRALIEERIGVDYIEELKKAKRQEDLAADALQDAKQARAAAQQVVVTEFRNLLANWTLELEQMGLSQSVVDSLGADVLTAVAESLGGPTQPAASAALPGLRSLRPQSVAIRIGGREIQADITPQPHPITGNVESVLITPKDPRLLDFWKAEFVQAVAQRRRVRQFIESFEFRRAEHRQIFEKERDYFRQIEAAVAADPLSASLNLRNHYILIIGQQKDQQLLDAISRAASEYFEQAARLAAEMTRLDAEISEIYADWLQLRRTVLDRILDPGLRARVESLMQEVDSAFHRVFEKDVVVQFAALVAQDSRRPLDHKKFLDMLIDDVEEKYIELLEGTRAHTANIDNYLARLATALEDDFNTQFYYPAFRNVREASRFWDVQLGQIEFTSILTNNRQFAKVAPQATMEFDLPKRDILINEAFESALAAYSDYGALLGDPNFLALTKLYSGQPTSNLFNSGLPHPAVRDVLPGLPSTTDERLLIQADTGRPEFASQLEALIPDPAIYKFETGTGFEIRPVIQPDGQAVVFHFNYMYTTNVREPVRADEKHLGRVKRHFIDTDVQTGNFELREVSRYQVALKASRTGRGVPFLEDVPGLGLLFRPLPQQESSLQQNIILAQSTIFPTLFDLMGLRWAPAVADLDALRLIEADFVTRGRQRVLENRVFDYSSHQVDEFLRVPQPERRGDLYRTQETIPWEHPNGYIGPGLGQQDSHLREDYDPRRIRPETRYVPGRSPEGVPLTPFYGEAVPPAGPRIPVDPETTIGPADSFHRMHPVPQRPDAAPLRGPDFNGPLPPPPANGGAGSKSDPTAPRVPATGSAFNTPVNPMDGDSEVPAARSGSSRTNPSDPPGRATLQGRNLKSR